MAIEIIEVTDAAGAIAQPLWLSRAEPVHRQLRQALPPEYESVLRRVFAGGGRMAVAASGERVVGVAVFRIYENTYAGRQMYVDDLVTDAESRSTGVGQALLHWLKSRARMSHCDTFALDSGTQRHRAHAFYFRERLPVVAFHFSRRLEELP